jgi:hypothetical protein
VSAQHIFFSGRGNIASNKDGWNGEITRIRKKTQCTGITPSLLKISRNKTEIAGLVVEIRIPLDSNGWSQKIRCLCLKLRKNIY